MAWIESHQGLGRHPKTKQAARALGISRVQLVGHLHYLWWWALDFAEDGNLSDIDPYDIAEEAMWEGDPDAFIDALTAAGFLTPEHHINDWDDYTGRLISQREKNRERQRRFRERHRDETVFDPSPNGDVTVTSRERNGATVPNPTQPNQTEPTTTNDGADAPGSEKTAIEQRFDSFWSVYPKKVGKGAARAWWKKRKPSQELTDTMISAVRVQSQSDQWSRDSGQYIPNPATWLNQERWEDDLPTFQNSPANVTPFQNSQRKTSNSMSSYDLAAYARDLERQGQ